MLRAFLCSMGIYLILSFKCKSCDLFSALHGIHARTVTNMTPADIRKEGSAYDLPLAINARDEGFRGIIPPIQNAREAGVIA